MLELFCSVLLILYNRYAAIIEIVITILIANLILCCIFIKGRNTAINSNSTMQMLITDNTLYL